jgi:hypothetical protein
MQTFSSQLSVFCWSGQQYCQKSGYQLLDVSPDYNRSRYYSFGSGWLARWPESYVREHPDSRLTEVSRNSAVFVLSLVRSTESAITGASSSLLYFCPACVTCLGISEAIGTMTRQDSNIPAFKRDREIPCKLPTWHVVKCRVPPDLSRRAQPYSVAPERTDRG